MGKKFGFILPGNKKKFSLLKSAKSSDIIQFYHRNF